MNAGDARPAPAAPSGRLFLAVPLSDAVRAALGAHLAGAVGPTGLPGRVVRPESWHLTLRFLGDTSPAAGARLVRALESADLGAPFSIRFGGLGAFPRAERAQVIWLGIRDGADRLRALAQAVEASVVAAGFAPDSRPFAAHLTLARVRPAVDVRSLVARAPVFGGALDVERVVLYRSHLGRAGSVYEEAAAWWLGGPGPR